MSTSDTLPISRPVGDSFGQRMRRGWRRHRFPYLLLAPTVFLLLAFLIVPFFTLFYYGFFETMLDGTTNFVGLGNFNYLFHEVRFGRNVINSLLYVFGNLALSIPIAYFGALLVTSGSRGGGLLRTMLLIPWILAPVVTALLFRTMLNPSGGPIIKQAYAEPGSYTARLTLTDDEGCSTEFIFTGQTAYCSDGAGAAATAEVTVQDALGGLVLKLKRKLKGNKLRAKATCEAAACSATLKGKVTVKNKGKASAAASKAKLKPKTVDLAANEKTTVKLKLKRKGRSSVKRALRRDGKVKAKVTGRATDAFGNLEKAKKKAGLR